LAPYTLHDTLFQYFRGNSATSPIADQVVTSLKKDEKGSANGTEIIQHID
jgi:hypothetical protein